MVNKSSRAAIVKITVLCFFGVWVTPSTGLHNFFRSERGRDSSMPTSISGQKLLNVRLKSTLSGNTKGVTSIRFSPDGRVIAIGSRDGTVRLWDAATARLNATLNGNKGRIKEDNLRFSPDGLQLASFGLNDKDVRLWDVATGQLKTVLHGHEARLRVVNFSPDGRTIVTAGDDKTAKLWDARTGQLKTELRDRGNKISVLAFFSPDGNILLTRDCCRRISLWNAGTATLIRSIEHDGLIFVEPAFSPDGRFVATASEEKTNDMDVLARLKNPPNPVYLWDASTGQLIQKLVGHEASIFDLIFSPNGRLLATASRDGTAKVWDVATGQLKFTTERSEQIARRVVFSPDGQTLAVGYYDQARLWDVATGQLKSILAAHQDEIEISFNLNGRVLVTTSDKIVKVWDARSGELIATLNGARPPVSFSPDGRTLATAGENNTALLWDVLVR